MSDSGSAALSPLFALGCGSRRDRRWAAGPMPERMRTAGVSSAPAARTTALRAWNIDPSEHTTPVARGGGGGGGSAFLDTDSDWSALDWRNAPCCCFCPCPSNSTRDTVWSVCILKFRKCRLHRGSMTPVNADLRTPSAVRVGLPSMTFPLLQSSTPWLVEGKQREREEEGMVLTCCNPQLLS